MTRYPVFIPSKGRWENPLTSRCLTAMGIEHKVVVEAPERDVYAKSVGESRLLVLPTVGKGLTVTRNWIWDYASSLGVERYWTFDDNISHVYRFNRNCQIRCVTSAPLRAIEDFVERYRNVPMAGMQYFMFVPRKGLFKNPILLNTRVYSNMLIKTDACDRRGKPYRFECFYNDDTDLCLRMLKDGFCTMLFYAFLVHKMATMVCKGGNTDHYQDEGRWRMAEELRAKHPDVVTIKRKWGRWQHVVDYRPFKNNRLVKRKDIEIASGVDNYGMKLVRTG